MKVFVYRNLNKKCISIKFLEGEHKGKVVFHASSVKLKNVIYKCNEKGRERVLATKQKNVHAGLIGELVGIEILEIRYKSNYPKNFNSKKSNYSIVTYNPYKHNSFVYKENNKNIYKSDFAEIIINKNQFIVKSY